ncbi:MAG TPA: glutamate racemase [Candidatus Babeliales bacterium]|nr:glutamate racemase [Candidatus Babeliales bacterium]
MKQRIGVFDSGIGGLTVLQQLMTSHAADYFYVADTANLPYGNKTAEQIKLFSAEIVSFLITKQIDICIIACHTSSAIAFNDLQKSFTELRIIGVMNSVCQVAAAQTKTGQIGIIATPATIARHAHKETLLSLNDQFTIIEQACPELVPTIEAPKIDREKIKVLLEEYLAPMKTHCVDTLIVGCTHYALIKDEIKKILGEHVKLISADETIVLENFQASKTSSSFLSSLECFVTGDKNYFDQKASSLLTTKVNAKQINFTKNSPSIDLDHKIL